MTIAEQLRKEVDIHKELPWLREETIKHLRWDGVYRLICDHHIEKISENFSIPFKYYEPVERWARSEGLRVYSTFNSYGVRSINISL